ncbi:hypothetical protein [Candidatus Ruthia endofausta]|nr:hypothetical protein [Candidatus Ruthia endofausta]
MDESVSTLFDDTEALFKKVIDKKMTHRQ